MPLDHATSGSPVDPSLWPRLCYGDPASVRALLARPDLPGKDQGRPLAFAGLQRAHDDVLALIEAANLPFDGTDDQRSNAWHWAAPRRNMVAWLIDRPHRLDRTGLNALNAQQHTPLQIALGIVSDGGQNHVTNALLLIAAGADVTAMDPEGDTLLHLVADPLLATTLVAAGAPVDRTTPEGETPLFRAVVMGLDEVVDALLNDGANPNRGLHGISPLRRSVADGSWGIARRLVAAGANPLHRGPDGKTPRDLAGRWPAQQAQWEAPALREVVPDVLAPSRPRNRL